MSEKGNKFIKGAAILGMAGIVIKFLGAIFRIPLTNWIGSDGMSYYGVAYTIYSALLVLSTAGIPVAISKMVSERIAVGEYKNAHKVFKVATAMLFVIGIVSFGVCYFGGEFIAEMFGNKDAALAVKAISPALLFVPLFSSFRGYFQGRQNMNPTAVSEITEQVVRVAVGLYLAYTFWKSAGNIESAAGATFGASAGAIAGLGIIVIIYLLNRRVIHRKIDTNIQRVEETSSLVKQIVYIAVPIIIGCEIMPMMTLIDTSIIMNRLQATGWTFAEAKSQYGLLSGFCSPLIAFPQIFTQAVAVSLVPAIAAKFKVNDKQGVQDNIKLGYRTTMIMAFPCALGIFALAEPILWLLYSSQKASASDAVPTLMIMAVSVIFLAVTQTSVGVLQSIGKQMVPVKHLAIGCVGKVIVTYILVGIPELNIMGAAIGTMVAYFVALVLNNRTVKKLTGTTFDYGLTYIRPGMASVIMGICAFASYKLISGALGNSLATLISIGVGGIIYVVLIFAMKAITLDEVATMPGGTKLVKIIGKFVR
ncbi:stage V sporulation protein B [Clostridiales Family XIII bacterium PM5-7]